MEGESMSEWKEVRLGDYIKDIAAGPFGSNLKVSCFVDKGFPIIDGANLKSFKVTDNITKYVTDEKARSLYRSIAKRGDIVVTISGNVGQISYIPFDSEYEEYLVSQRQFRATIDETSINVPFLVYYFHTRIGQSKILSFANQVGVPALAQPLKNFRNILITIPEVEEQKKIAGILSSLDAKIETNNKLNEKLEEMAQAIFKSWFVDFEPFKNQPFHDTEIGMIPEGWRIVSLDDLTSKFGTGLNPRKNFILGQGNNYYVTIKNMSNNRIYLDEKCDRIDDDAIIKINLRSKLKKGDLLFSGIGTIGRVALVNETPTNWNTSESVFNMHPSKLCTSEFLYVLLLSNILQKYVKINALGAVQQGIRMASLKAFSIAIPDENTMTTFLSIIKPIIDYIQYNNKENDRLASLRDTLLPRLMSGEIKL